MRRSLFIAIVPAPLVALCALVACSAGNGEAVPGDTRDTREAGAVEASTGKPKPIDGSAASDGSSGRDGGADAGKDAHVDAESDSSAEAVVDINEIYVDIDGFGDGAEFIELRGAPGTAVDDLTLRLLDATGKVEHVVSVGPLGGVVGTSGLWVVGGAQTFKLGVPDKVDQVVLLSAWGLQTSRGAVQLVRGAQLLDAVSWSTAPDAGAIPAPTQPPLATGEGTPTAPPTITKATGKPAHSFGREANALDTNDNAADFCSMVASPGHDQAACD